MAVIFLAAAGVFGAEPTWAGAAVFGDALAVPGLAGLPEAP